MSKLYSYCLAATLFLAQNLGAQPVSPTINDAASRVFGQPKLQATEFTRNPNLIEGRELASPQAIAFDTSVSPPIMYVSDTGNNRVLAWRNSTALSRANFADLVIGQRKGDFNSTGGLGPGTALSTGLLVPGGLAVDKQGNLYVCDTGNNRILRYPAPFNQTGDLLQVDLVIGQRTVSSGRTQNQGNAAPTEKTLAFSNSGGAQITGLAFDASGNLWATDPLNHRVLRYPVAKLAPDTQEPAADLVIGQINLITGTQPSPLTQTNKQNLFQPSGLAFDTSGNLYVLDSISRVLFYRAPLQTFQVAARVLGINPATTPQTPYPNLFTLGLPTSAGQISPSGIFTVGDNLFVVDTPAHRVVHYDLPTNWPAETTPQFSPPLIGNALGQIDFTFAKSNRGNAEPDATSFSAPVAGAAVGNEIWIVDSFNNRVLSFGPNAPLNYTTASRVIGQLDFNFFQPNLVEGREVNFGNYGGGVVVDRNSNPPHLYIADSTNHRILCFRDGRAVLTGSKADRVIGQPDLLHSIANYPNGFVNGALGTPNDSSLAFPLGLAVDSAGNLFVADSGNGRVLRFPAPFSQPSGMIRANLVLGQINFTNTVTDASSQNMKQPWGVALLADGSLVASDVAHNRVLIFRKPKTGDFVNFQRAEAVLGQNDFTTTASGNDNTKLNGPRHMGVDSSDRLYVADTGNNRVQIFTAAGVIQNGSAAVVPVLGLNQPQAVTVSLATGEAFIANTGSNQVARIPEFTKLLQAVTITALITSVSPVALALDSSDNIVVAEAVNRVAFFYAKLAYQHAATYNSRGLAPGMLALLFRAGKPFTLSEGLVDGSQSSPWPTTLGDVQVTVNGTLAPIFHVIPERIDFQVPYNVPTTGAADVVVSRPSTGEIIAAASLPLVASNPGFFSSNASGFGQLAATQATGINGPTLPVKVGNSITLYGTGLGLVPNAPPDGVSPSGELRAPGSTQVFINSQDAEFSKDPNGYSGLGAFPGGWQLNVKVPTNISCPGGPPICSAISAVAVYNNFPSNLGAGDVRLATTISTQQ